VASGPPENPQQSTNRLSLFNRQLQKACSLEYFMVGMMAAAIIASLLLLTRLALAQLRRPVLTGDSWAFVSWNGHNLAEWLLCQHNEHRIVLARMLALIETSLFGLPPTSTAGFQNLFLVLLSSGLLALCCNQLLARPRNQLLTWLACTLVLVNPWQWENFTWEFQVPWFWINSLVFAGTLLLIHWGKHTSPHRHRILLVAAAALPWAGIYSSGQGFALSISFSLVSLLISRKLAVVSIGSLLLSSVVYLRLLGYVSPTLRYFRPANLPPLTFDPDYFAKAVLGGPWQGLSIIILALGGYLILIRRRSFWQPDTRKSVESAESHRYLPALFPGIFAFVFVAMITASRSGFGIGQAEASRYVTHTLLLAVSIVMLSAIASEIHQSPHTGRHARPDPRTLYPSFVVILSTIFSFPQVVTKQAPLFRETWRNALDQRSLSESTFRCIARKARFMNGSQVSTETEKCDAALKTIHPEALDLGLRYFSEKTTVKLTGWHRQVADENSPSK
jgi:hypothetical protein